MPERFTPRPYQELIVEHIVQNPRCAVFAGMGLGKTASVLTALDRISTLEDVYPALVVAPLRVAQSVWPDEARKWEEFAHLRVQPILGGATERSIKLLVCGVNLYTINYENLPWLVKFCNENGGWPFKTIIADESTKLKGLRLRQGTARARALASVAFQSKRFIALSGTPAPNGLQDLWGQLWFIDKGARLGRSYQAFIDRWFAPTYDGWGVAPMPWAQEQIQAAISDVCMSLNAADHFDLKYPIVNKIYVDLPPSARKLYRDMEKEMMIEIEGTDITALNAAAKTMKCLQLANGAAYIGENSEEWVEVHDAKIKALEDVIEEAAGMPVLVAYNFRSDLDRLRKAFPRARVLDRRPDTLREWNTGQIPILLAHPASAGHGLNLQDGGNILVFFGLNWNLEEHQQIIERIGPTRQAQAGYRRPVFIHHIIARKTVDELVLKRLETKRKVQDVLMEAMKGGGAS